MRRSQRPKPSQARRRQAATTAAMATPVVLAQFSTRLPPELLERLREAPPQLGLHQYEITAAALDAYLSERRL